MKLDKSKILTAVTADTVSERVILDGIYGYFAHDLDSLEKAVTSSRQTGRCLYGRLTKIMGKENRARFVIGNGQYIFSLFYPTDNFMNTERY